MSGGVDSAVALLQAGPGAVGVTLRLWIDPNARRERARLLLAGRGDRRARDLPSRAGIPHVTLDLREEFRRAVVEPFVARLRARARRRTRASAATAASASTSCSPSPTASAPRGSRPATTRASSSATGAARSRRAADAAKDQSYMLATLDPARARPALVPARRADEGADARRGRGGRASPPRAGPRARRRASSAATTTATSSAATGLAAAPGRRRRRGRAARLGTHDGFWRFTPGPAPRARRRGGRAALRARRPTPRRTPSSSARARRSPAAASRCAAACDRDARPGRGEAPPPLAGASRRRVTAAAGGFELLLDEPAYGVAPGQTAVLYDDDAVVGSGVIVARSPADVRSPRARRLRERPSRRLRPRRSSWS